MQRSRYSWWLCFIGLLFILSAWNLSNPPGSGTDEGSSIVKASATVRGQFIGTVVPNASWLGVKVYRVTVPNLYAQMFSQTSCASQSKLAHCPLPPNGKYLQSPETGTTYQGNYPPFYFILTGIPTLLPASVPGSINLMREMSILVECALIASSITTLFNSRKNPYSLVGMFLALTPTAISLFTNVNAMGLEIASATAVVVQSLTLVTEPSVPKRTVLRLCIASVVMVLSRPDSLLFYVVDLLPTLLLLNRSKFRHLIRLTQIKVWMGVSGSMLLLESAWQIYAGPGLTPRKPILNYGSVLHRMILSYHNQLDLISYEGLVGRFNNYFQNLSAPRLMYILWTAALLSFFLAGLFKIAIKDKLRVVVFFVVALLALMSLEAYLIPSLGVFWQGFNSLPVYISLPIYIGFMIDRSRKSTVAYEKYFQFTTLLIWLACISWSEIEIINWSASLHFIPLFRDPFILALLALGVSLVLIFFIVMFFAAEKLDRPNNSEVLTPILVEP